MKVPTSIRINKDILDHLKSLNIEIGAYINQLIISDLQTHSLENTKLNEFINKALADERKNVLIQEMKLIGAINNIPERIKNMSKGDDVIFMMLLKKNIDMLNLEYEFDYSQDTKHLIKSRFMELTAMLKEIEPTAETKKIKSGKKKKKSL